MRLASEVAESLNQLARKPGYDAGLLAPLAESVQTGRDARAWSEVEMADVLSKRRGTDRDPTPLIVLSTLRDLLFLGPIAVTWFELRAAFDAFRSFGSANPDVPFIAAWQRGFDGAGPSFGKVALEIVLLVAAIALLSLIVSIIRSRLTASDAATRGLAIEVMFQLGKHLAVIDRPIEPQLGAVEVRVQQLDESLTTLLEVIEDLETSLVPLADGLNASATAQSKLDERFERLSAHFAEYEENSRELLASTAGTAEDIRHTSSSLVTGVDALVPSIGRLAAELENASDAGASSSDLILQSNQVLASTGELANRLARVLDDLMLQIAELETNASSSVIDLSSDATDPWIDVRE